MQNILITVRDVFLLSISVLILCGGAVAINTVTDSDMTDRL